MCLPVVTFTVTWLIDSPWLNYMYDVSCLSLGLNLNSNLDSNVIRYDFTETWYTLLTHWGRVTHICVSKLTVIGSGNGLSPGRRQLIVRTNAGILLIGPYDKFQWHFNRNANFSLKKMHMKMSSENCRPLCLGLNVWNCHLPMAITWYDKFLKTHDELFMFMSKFKLASNVRKLMTLFSNMCTPWSPPFVVTYDE